MARRNLFFLMAAGVVSLLCYHNVQDNRYGRILVDAMEHVERRALGPVEQEELFLGAMEGMVDRLDDPYSSFIEPTHLSKFNEILDQEFGGVGMEVSIDRETKQLTVMSPLVGTPAYEAGIRAGDKILRIDDQSTQGLSLKDAVGLMRGKPGHPVTLSILHEGDEQPIDVVIVRAIIHIDTILGDTRRADGSWNFFLEGHDRIGYLRINSFAKDTAGELRRAMVWLMAHDVQGLILDLRDDPGGLLPAAIDVADTFVDAGVIVTTRHRGGSIKELFTAEDEDTFGDFPMAVLVNKHSASASEIVAACLQDHRRAVVVGQRTWGKGTVQEVIELEGGQGALKLTTASYWRPSEKNIHKDKGAGEDDDWGVSPDPGYEVVVEGDQLTQLRLWRMRRDVFQGANDDDTPPDGKPEPFVDPQLAKAVEYVEKAVGGRQ